MRPQTWSNIFIGLLDQAYEAPLQIQNGTPTVARNPFILWRSGTQYVVMLTKLFCSYCGAHLVQSHCKESNMAEISFFIIFYQNLVECMMSSLGLFAYFINLNISGTKRYLNTANNIFLLTQPPCLCFKMAMIGKMQFHHSTTLNFDMLCHQFHSKPLVSVFSETTFCFKKSKLSISWAILFENWWTLTKD